MKKGSDVQIEKRENINQKIAFAFYRAKLIEKKEQNYEAFQKKKKHLKHLLLAKKQKQEATRAHAYQGHERVGRSRRSGQVAGAAGFQERLGHLWAVGQRVDQNVNLAVVRLRNEKVPECEKNWR